MPITIYVYIIGDGEVDICGLSGRERLGRMITSWALTMRATLAGSRPDRLVFTDTYGLHWWSIM